MAFILLHKLVVQPCEVAESARDLVKGRRVVHMSRLRSYFVRYISGHAFSLLEWVRYLHMLGAKEVVIATG